MLTARRPFGGADGRIALRAMASADPWTVGAKGYPLLLQSGESYLFTRTVKLEASAFNGREPDGRRTDFDFRKIDSYSTRIAVNPGDRWTVSAWYAYLASPEELHPDESMHRYGGAVLTAQRGGRFNGALVWGANAKLGGATSHSLLVEGDLVLRDGHHVFGRGEYVRKTAEDLVIAGQPADRAFDLTSLAGGYLFERVALGLGVRGSIGFVPASLAAEYGSRSPLGVAVFGRWRPK